MQTVQIDQFTIYGLTTRTRNSDELEPQKAKIGQLWQDFFQASPIPDNQQSVTCYGAYSNFGSDENGAFDITAGIVGKFPSKNSAQVTIPAGTYLRFEKKGEIPAAVIELWQEVWQFFAKDDAPPRLFSCDFEEYPEMDTVAIYIGISEGSYD